jgi:D-serine deaminase-like pyridoxal phosphate-dependent protein
VTSPANVLNHERPVDVYREAIGRSRHALTTPALILDLDILRRNISTMAEWNLNHAKVRPHTKIHKCVEIARLQVAAGAVGLTTATVWETIVMVRAGLDNISIANQVVGEEKLSRLAQIAHDSSIIVAVDSVASAEALSRAAVVEGGKFRVLVDLECGIAPRRRTQPC